MFQNIVVSPLFLNSFSSIELEKGQSIMASLVTETFLCDCNKKLLLEYEKVKEYHKNDPKSLLFIESFIKSLTLGKVKLINNVKAQNRHKNDWEHYSTEKQIALLDQWKIILTNDCEKEFSDEIKKNLDIELSDAENYSCPSEHSRIRTMQRINKLPGDQFHFRNWVVKFIKDSKYLIVHDGYACAKNEFRDVEFMIKTLPQGAKVNIITLSDQARNNSRGKDFDDGIVAEDLLSRLKNEHPSKVINWELKNEKILLEDRHIQTEKFFINLGHALGSTYKDVSTGKILCKKQFTITVSKAS